MVLAGLPQGRCPMSGPGLRRLVLVLGDQLDPKAAAFDGFDARHDAVWIAEVDEESTHVRSSKARTALFLSAMRHFVAGLHEAGVPVHAVRLDDPDNTRTLAGELRRVVQRLRPAELVMTAPGDWRVLAELRATARDLGLPLDVREDRHFYSTVREFADHARGRRQLRLEHWYRLLRRRTGILMDGDEPVGGQWNFDADNRESFGRDGPGEVPPPARFAPDAITREVIALVNRRYADHPGSLEDFAWPVTPAQAREALAAFVRERLPAFGRWQDAMWSDEPWLYHAHLAAAMNLRLLDPREAVDAAVAAWREGGAPLPAVEGFVRQILGWREYVRGVYWTQMPDYAQRNALDAQAPLPAFYWDGRTDMACLRDAIGQTLRLGYAHHIQRLMVTGLYALLLGVRPTEVHAWYLAVYVDAVEWVELPNTLGMSQYADGGVMASKPYVATGRYIDRMSNHCRGCRYDPAQATGPRACPYTTLYWDFLARHEAALAGNARMTMQLRNLQRLSPERRAEIAAAADAHRRSVGMAPAERDAP
jgi:deoxyribodipyrimidine photolyase-related protein